MIAADYVKIFPLSYYFERLVIPFYAPKDGFFDVLPRDILQFFRENATVSNLQKMKSEGWAIIPEELKLGRGIAIDFRNSDHYSGMIFHLFETEILDFDKETGIVKIMQTLPDTPPSKDEFNAWVSQSINSAARKYFDQVYTENLISANLGATYLCSNDFSNELLSKHFNTKGTIETFTATQVLNMELPFLDKIDIDKLMSIRQSDTDTFFNFRIELEKQFRELRTISDPKELQLRTENILHELNIVQTQKISQRLKHLKKKAGIDAALALGSLAASFQSQDLGLVGLGLAIGKGYRDYNEYLKNIKENPSYLLWKVKPK